MPDTTAAKPRNRARRRVVTLGRALGTGATVLWIMVAAQGELGALSHDAAILAALLTMASAGILVSWWNAAGAVLLLVAGGVALSGYGAYEAHRNEWVVAAVLGGPYVVSGLLILPATRRQDWTGT